MSRRWVKWAIPVAALGIGTGVWGGARVLLSAPQSAARHAGAGKVDRPAKAGDGVKARDSVKAPSTAKAPGSGARSAPGRPAAAAESSSPSGKSSPAAKPAAPASPKAATATGGAAQLFLGGRNHVPAAAAYATPAKAVHDGLFAPLDPKRPKVVYLTFDDGPNLTMTPRVLAVLRAAKVHATFFVVGSQVGAATAPVLRQTLAQGNAIGLHSFSHTYGFEKRGSAAATTREVTLTLAALRRALGPGFATHAWRYPGGHMSWSTLAAPDRALAQAGLSWIDWNDAVGDALGESGPHSVAGYLAYHRHALDAYGTHNTEVVLMHDAAGKALTLSTLPKLIADYKARVYRFGIIE
ncbi:polysaccharide deacetylase family protein [Lacticaseibacillus kribbianus]|uniref:polysaccharide deacetylase family protein n=1 Tax=Lacticaseibacillus kribbianus TaxID=2926292 RepID=UPI001CD19FBA|nr:polysaccharide deacetylase family protein [Lacticaseibacillus kribbianus]